MQQIIVCIVIVFGLDSHICAVFRSPIFKHLRNVHRTVFSFLKAIQLCLFFQFESCESIRMLLRFSLRISQRQYFFPFHLRKISREVLLRNFNILLNFIFQFDKSHNHVVFLSLCQFRYDSKFLFSFNLFQRCINLFKSLASFHLVWRSDIFGNRWTYACFVRQLVLKQFVFAFVCLFLGVSNVVVNASLVYVI